MSVVCELIAPFLANSAVDGSPVGRILTSHVDECLRCQARHAAMTKTARALRSLTERAERAPVDLEWRVMSSLEGELAIPRSWLRPVAVAAALLSMAAAVVIWKMRPRTS
jgi:anti-sigma factor RsiW